MGDKWLYLYYPWMQVKRKIFSIKYLTIILLIGFISVLYTANLRKMCYLTGSAVAPWLLPFFLSLNFYSMIYCALYCLLYTSRLCRRCFYMDMNTRREIQNMRMRSGRMSRDYSAEYSYPYKNTADIILLKLYRRYLQNIPNQESSIRSLANSPPLACSNFSRRSLTSRLRFSSPRTS